MFFQILLHFLLFLGFFRLCRGENKYEGSEQFKTYTFSYLKNILHCWKFTLENTTIRRWRCKIAVLMCISKWHTSLQQSRRAPAVPGRCCRRAFPALGAHLPLLPWWAGQEHPASASCGGQWLPAPSGWHPSASSGPAPAAASAHRERTLFRFYSVVFAKSYLQTCKHQAEVTREQSPRAFYCSRHYFSSLAIEQ